MLCASTLHRQYLGGAAILTTSDSPPEPLDTPSAAGQLPAAFDLFVGRERELTDLAALLRRNRLLSVVGPVGVGKTRFAAELAQRVKPSFPGGVTWVELASVIKSWHVASAIGTADRYADRGAALLVLDNCEHLLDGVADVVATMLTTAPDLHILTTSREALRTQGETILDLKPLHADAVRLFTARALEVKPDFDADAQSGLIAEICHRLDGLPLAIELAAHNMDVLTPQALRAQ